MNQMETMLRHPIVLIWLTITVFWIVNIIRTRTGNVLVNPVLCSTVVMIMYLKLFDIDYPTYHEAAVFIDFWLKPAVVGLAVPLYFKLGQNPQTMVAHCVISRRRQHYRHCKRGVSCQTDGGGT